MAQLFANAARSTLTASITASATQLQINPADQGLFPVASGSDWFKVAVEDSSGNIEYIKVQRAVGSPLLFVMSGGRAVEDSAKFPARAFNAGSLVELRMTAADLALSIAHPSVGTNAHAASAIAFTPVKTLAAANVQAAIEELLTEGGLDTLALQGDVPQITFDTGDYLLFNRDTNLLNVVIGGAGRFYVDASGPARETDATTANGLVRRSQLDTAVSGRLSAIRLKVFSTAGSHTYTPHPAMQYAHVEIVGGGGAGGGFINGANSGGAAGGGGAGAWAAGLFSAETIGASQPIVVGAGGVGSTGNGGNGGTTSFGSLMSASGGMGTAASVTAGATYVSGGAGGSTVSGGYARSNGGGGGSGWGGWVSGVFSGGMGGVGGASRFGGGGSGGGSGTGPAGGNASAPGAGGGGVGGGQNNNAAGGSGAPGIVIVTEYCTE